MAASDLKRAIRRGVLGLLKVFRRNSITIRGFLKLYKERFATRAGFVTVKDAALAPVPAPEPASAVDPAPGLADFQKLSMVEQIRIADTRTAARKLAKKTARAQRLRNVQRIHGRG